MSTFQNTNIQRTIENITEMPQKIGIPTEYQKLPKIKKTKINNSPKNTYKSSQILDLKQYSKSYHGMKKVTKW